MILSKSFERLSARVFVDGRGKLLKLFMKSDFEGQESFEEAYVLYSQKNAIRGNHYHKNTLEHFIVIKGTALVVLKDICGGPEEVMRVCEKDNAIIRVPAYVAHAFKNELDDELIIVALSTKQYDASDKDTFVYELLH